MAETTDPNTAAPPDEAPKSYSSLSLLALGGLAVAVVYALVVLVGAAVALFDRMPWILPTWSLAVPVAAVVLCWAARVQIQNSEGALTGALDRLGPVAEPRRRPALRRLLLRLLPFGHANGDHGRRRDVRRPQERPTRPGVPARPSAAAARRRRRPTRPSGTGIRPRPRGRRPVHHVPSVGTCSSDRARRGRRPDRVPRRQGLGFHGRRLSGPTRLPRVHAVRGFRSARHRHRRGRRLRRPPVVRQNAPDDGASRPHRRGAADAAPA